MAVIESIRIRNLRCIRTADATFPPGLVWVHGPNGAGKTTLVEAIYLLDRGRTFRGRRGGTLTTRGEAGTSVIGVFRDSAGLAQRREWHSRRASRSGIPGQLTRFVGATSFNILEGEPSLRRRFFDWALFHVERDARQLWARVARLQSQRNAWLRSGGGGIAVWDAPYVEQLRALWDRRLRYLKDLDFAFRRLTAKHLAVGELGLQWRWLGEGRDLFEILQAHRSSDRARGFTHLSASRGDVSFVQDGLDWQGSRGENKIAGILLQLAVHSVMAATTGQKPIVLLDDPYSEVSAGGVAPLLSAWMAVSDQMIVTCLGNAGGGALRAHPGTVFHVERGILSRSRPVDGDS